MREKMQSYRVTELQSRHCFAMRDAELQGYRVTELRSYGVTVPPLLRNAGCRIARFQSCRVAELQSYRVTELIL